MTLSTLLAPNKDSSTKKYASSKCSFSFVLAFAGLTVVEPPEGIVFGDVGVKELEWVLWDNSVWDYFVVSNDISKRESTESVFSVRLHRVELDFTCEGKYK